MIVKILIFLCSLCVVKAYLVVNIFDDGVKTRSSLTMGVEGSLMISGCNPLGCVQICRRLGLKGGVCIQGKCQCSLFMELEDADIQTTPLMELEKSPPISECSPLGCAQICRHIGLKGGVCVHVKCKCDLFVEGDTQRSLTICDWSSCDRGCRSIGYPGGSCVESKCSCDPQPFKAIYINRIDSTDGKVQVLELEKPSPMISDCNPLFCDQQCHRMFLKGGVCVNGRCKCDVIVDSGESKMELYKKSSVKICDATDCAVMCRRIRFIGGLCDGIKDTCQCF